MNKPELVKYVESLEEFKQFPEFKAGDTITVDYTIKEGNKTRTQRFTGIVLQIKGTGNTKTFTVRKISGNIGVERIFPFASPNIERIEVNKRGAVRRARIFYLRKLRGKKSKNQRKAFLMLASKFAPNA